MTANRLVELYSEYSANSNSLQDKEDRIADLEHLLMLSMNYITSTMPRAVDKDVIEVLYIISTEEEINDENNHCFESKEEALEWLSEARNSGIISSDEKRYIIPVTRVPVDWDTGIDEAVEALLFSTEDANEEAYVLEGLVLEQDEMDNLKEYVENALAKWLQKYPKHRHASGIIEAGAPIPEVVE